MKVDCFEDGGFPFPSSSSGTSGNGLFSLPDEMLLDVDAGSSEGVVGLCVDTLGVLWTVSSSKASARSSMLSSGLDGCRACSFGIFVLIFRLFDIF